jgi:hypothetical protein
MHSSGIFVQPQRPVEPYRSNDGDAKENRVRATRTHYLALALTDRCGRNNNTTGGSKVKLSGVNSEECRDRC